MKKNSLKTIARIVCLLGLCIGLYRTDITSILVLFSVLCAAVWLIPGIIDLIFKDNECDGVMYIDTMNDNKTAIKISFKDPLKAIHKDFVVVKVNIMKNILEETMEENNHEEE
jgi:hypothetical protein